ncbi:MAG: hypothetical protein ACE5HL_09490 [Terriglobia bacterium]
MTEAGWQHGGGIPQEALGTELHRPPPPGSFPQAKALVSKISSEVQVGLLYGFLSRVGVPAGVDLISGSRSIGSS